MTEYEEIVQLRKSGQNNKAYEKATKVMSDNPECIWVYTQLGWCLWDRIKQSINTGQVEVFFSSLQEISDISSNHLLDVFVLKAIMWPIREFVATHASMSHYEELNNVFAIIKKIPFQTNDENYHVLLQPFLKAKEWDGLKYVIEWWGLDNLKPSDYIPYTKDNGQKIMSFAEQVLIAYSRILLKALAEKKITPEVAKKHIQRLEIAASVHPDLQYPRYFQAQLMLAIGDNEGVVETLLPFVRQKRKDYWVWELLGEAVSDKDTRLACFCKALSCHVKESFLRKLYFKTCDAFLALEKLPEAKTMLNKGIEISKVNKWQIPYIYQNYLQEEWYQQSIEVNIDNNVYKEYAAPAEQLLYSDKPKQVIIVTYVNKEKQVMNFLTEEKEAGFVRYCNILKQPRVGMILKCNMEKLDEKWKIYKIAEEMDTKAYEGKLIMKTSGIIKKKAKGFGFVDNVYIPEDLAIDFQDGQTINSVAIPQYNKSKGEWGWKAISVC